MGPIDGIAHVTADGRWFNTAFDASEGRLLREMDEAEVERAVVVGIADHVPNDDVFAACARWPDRLIPCPGFNPAAYATPAAMVPAARALRDSPAAAIKLHPRMNRYDCLGTQCRAFLDEAASWPKPPPIWLDSLLHHAAAALVKPPVEALHTLAVDYPGITFVFLHSCGVQVLELAQAVRACVNAHLDLSYTLHRYQGLSFVADVGRLAATFDRRIVWGSDFPEVGIVESANEARDLFAGLPEEKRRNIMGGNLRRILGLADG